MDSKTVVTLDTLLRAQQFLDANDGVLPYVNSSAARGSLDAAVAALRAEAYAQETARQRGKGETSKQRALRTTLVRQMRAVASIGRNNHGGVAELRTLRHLRGSPSLRLILARATALSTAIDDYPAVFAADGLSEATVAAFRATLAEVEALIAWRMGTSNERIRATGASVKLARDGRKAIGVLDALIHLAANGDATLLAGWRSAKLMPRVSAPAALSEPQEVTQAA